MQITLNEGPLDLPTSTLFDDDVLDYLAGYVVIEVDGERLPKKQIAAQFEFLARSAHITVNNWQKFVEEESYIRTTFSSMFKDYEKGMFKKSGILLLRESKAIDFDEIKETQPYLIFSLADKIIKWLDANHMEPI